MDIFGSKSYYVISMALIIFAMIFFALRFEKRKPATREVVSIAVMVSLAVIGRAAFFMTPQLKPMAAIVIITAVAYGKESGFLCGMLSAFISNFFFGQGPWTPWQMFALGLVGFLSGVLFYKRYDGKKIKTKDIVILCIFGIIVVVAVYGIIMDTATVLMYMDTPTMEAIFAAWAAGFIFNCIHGITTALIIFVLGKMILGKLNRMKIKFGMFR